MFALSTRVTIMLDDDIAEKIRYLQAKVIVKTQGSMSFSKMVNDTLRKGLKK